MVTRIGLLVFSAVVSGCAGMQEMGRWTPEVDVPEDGESYIVPQTSEDVYLRPTSSSPQIDRIYSTRSTPTLVQVTGQRPDETDGRWWRVNRDGKPGYIHTFSDSVAPYVPTDLPPEFDPMGSYEGDEPLITGVSPSRPNSANGVDVRIGLINPGLGRMIKYASFTIAPYNAVGDRVAGDLRDRREAELRLTGPVEADGAETWGRWENVFYNSTIDCVRLSEVVIEYADGSTTRLKGREIADILHGDAANDCRYQSNS